MDEGLLPTEALLNAADADLIETLAAVQQSALLAVLQALPPTTVATLQVRLISHFSYPIDASEMFPNCV